MPAPFAYTVLTPVALTVFIPFVGVTYKEAQTGAFTTEPVAQAAAMAAYAANHEEIYKSHDDIWQTKDTTRGKVSYEIVAGPYGEPIEDGRRYYDLILTITDINAVYKVDTPVFSTDFQAEADDYGTTRFWTERPAFTKP